MNFVTWPSPWEKMHSYRGHVQGLRNNIFADHLNLVQLAEAFGVRIQVLPLTPTGAAQPWQITTIDPCNAEQTLVLGNNDLHYVWLAPAE